MRILIPALCLIAICATARADDSAELRAFKTAIRAQYDMAESAYDKKDADTLVDNFFSKDAITIPPGPTVGVGHDQILAGYRAHLDGKMKLVSFRTRVNGNTGTDLANSYITPDDPNAKPVVFRALFVWERRGGKWLCTEEMFFPGEFAAAPVNGK